MNLFYPMLLTGLLTSFHCVMMCGNMVLSYAIKGESSGTLVRRMVPHVAYHSAKLFSYMLVGLLLGSVGSFISTEARSWVSVVAGAYMVLLGLSLTGRFPVLRHVEPRPPRFFVRIVSRLRRRSAADPDAATGIATPVSFGLITGLMPCGPLIAAQVAAAGSGSSFAGATMMLGFGLGTAPLMLGYGAVASYLGERFKRYMSVAAAVLIIVLGLVMADRGATALGSPVNFDAAKRAVIGTGGVEIDESAFKVGADGVVEVPLQLEGYTFTPSSVAIPADKRVRIIVDRKDDNLCSDELWIPSLGIKAPLTPKGRTEIEIPPTKAGTYRITCQMGMLSATLQVGSSAPRSSWPLLVFGVTAATGASGAILYVVSRRKKAASKRACEQAQRRPKPSKKSHKNSKSSQRKHK